MLPGVNYKMLKIKALLSGIIWSYLEYQQREKKV
jgi:hypothetical protein